MSNARKCDRCGKYYAPTNKTRCVQEFYASGVGMTRNGGDLCQKCTAKFDKWWNKKRREGK